MTLIWRSCGVFPVVRMCALRLLVITLGVVLAGCATGPNANPADPLEPLNRSVYKFNDAVDRTVFKPVATVYRDVTPSLVQRGIGNFFNNLEDAWSFVNNILQFKGAAAGDSFFRFGVNTVIGLGGVLDVATEMRIERHPEDFGQTLGYWGVGPGPYIVLPVLGPSNLRDTVALPLDSYKGDAVTYAGDNTTVYSLWALRATDDRADLLKAEAVLDEVALDKYSFIRDAYLQRRRNAVYDGDPPDEVPVEDAAPTDSSPK
jgi:phospholipid-binding lipoprotein MlaA